MASQFVRSLEATDLFLGQIAKLPSCKQVEDQRVKVLLGIVGKKSPWDAEAAAVACQSINGCKHLSKASKNALLKEVTLELGEGEACESTSSESKRTKLQDYTNVVHLMPKHLWDRLMDTYSNLDTNMMMLCHHCHLLGLCHASEKTYSTLTCLLFWSRWKDSMPDGNIKNRVLNISKPVLKQYLQQYQEQEPCAASQMLQTLPSKVDNLPKQLRMTFEKMEFARMDDRLMATLAAMPTRVTKRSVTMKVGILQDLSLRDALVLCPRKHGPESIEDAEGANRLEMLALADADPDLAADELIVKPKLKASDARTILGFVLI